EGPRRAAWRRRVLARWARLLDLIVLVDAPDPVLTYRLRTRTKAHPLKHSPDGVIHAFTARFRTAFHHVGAELRAASGPRLVTLMSAADGRPTEALRLVVSSRQAVEDDALQRRAVGAALLIWVLFLPLIAAVGAILIWIAPTITQVAPELRAGVRAVTALLLVSFFLTLVAGVPESVLRGMNLGYRRMGLQASLNVLAGLLTVVAVRAGLGLVGLGGAQG